MKEASDPKYFIDGFLIKHFGVWPEGTDKNNLFYEQKIFVIYLMGIIPGKEDWTVQVDYKLKLQEIEDIKDVKIDKTDIDLAELQGKDINTLRKERLRYEKEKRLKELNEKFGIKEEVKPIEDIEGLPDKVEKTNEQTLWEIIEGKGLVKKKSDG